MRHLKSDSRHSASLHFVTIVVGPQDLDALRSVVGALPLGSGFTVLVAQTDHTTPAEWTAESLAGATALTVSVPANGTQLLGDHVYLLPPREKVCLAGGKLTIERLPDLEMIASALDPFLMSFAAETGHAGIAVVLCDSAGGGTNGLRAVSAAGGKVFRLTAPSSMADLAHQIVALEEIPAIIARHSQPLEYRRELPDRPENVLDRVMNLLIKYRGVNFSEVKRTTLMRHLQGRMRLLKIKTSSSYVELLRQSPEEMSALIADLQIEVTDFFRDPEAWRRLGAEAIEPIIEQKRQGEPIRAWVPGCATGQDAYTLAILLLDHLDRFGKRNPIQIFATDTHDEALQIARSGHYAASIEKHVHPAQLRSFFLPKDADGRYQTVDRLREAVVFGRHDVFVDPPFSRLDLVVCRHLLTYLEPNKQQPIIAMFAATLNFGGYLFLGSKDHHLSDQPSGAFTAISKKWHIYRRNEVETREARQLPSSAPTTADDVEREVTELRRVHDVSQFVQQLLLDEYTAPAVLVNERHEAIYFSGSTDAFLAQPRGAPTQDIFQLAREGLRARLREALEKAAVSGLPVVEDALQARPAGEIHPVRLTVRPLTGARFPDRLFLVIFEALPMPDAVTDSRLTGQERQWMEQMETEYRVAEAELKAALRTVEGVNEALSLTNDELMSINEELSASREDAESMRQELQSQNDELIRANEVLREQLQEMQAADRELRTTLTCTQFLALTLDHDLCLRWISPGLIGLMPTESSVLGRPISDPAAGPGIAGLAEDVQAVLNSGRPVERQVHLTTEARYRRRVIPCAPSPGFAEGVVVTYSEVVSADPQPQSPPVDGERGSSLGGACCTSDSSPIDVPYQLPEARGRRALKAR